MNTITIEMVRLAIVGSRSFKDYDNLVDVLDEIKLNYGYRFCEIISGGARGADSLGARYADENGIKLTVFPADWDKYGKRAGFIRNVDIIKNCDICVCFWDGESHGTKHDIELCEEMSKPCFIYNFINCGLEFRKNR